MVLKSGVRYIVTIDVNNRTYAFDQTPFNGEISPLMTLGNGRFANGVGVFPASVDASARSGGVGLIYYRIASNQAEDVPVSVSEVFTVDTPGLHTFHLKGRRFENQGQDSTCSFSTRGMNAVFVP